MPQDLLDKAKDTLDNAKNTLGLDTLDRKKLKQAFIFPQHHR